MQFSNIFVTLASAMVVSSSFSANTAFSVNEFNAECIHHSSLCSYSFILIDLVAGENAETGAKCSGLVPSNGLLPAVSAGTCTGSSRTWTVTKPTTGGLVLTASEQLTAKSNTGSHTISESDLTTSTRGASLRQEYIGVNSFGLEK